MSNQLLNIIAKGHSICLAQECFQVDTSPLIYKLLKNFDSSKYTGVKARVNNKGASNSKTLQDIFDNKGAIDKGKILRCSDEKWNDDDGDSFLAIVHSIHPKKSQENQSD